MIFFSQAVANVFSIIVNPWLKFTSLTSPLAVRARFWSTGKEIWLGYRDERSEMLNYSTQREIHLDYIEANWLSNHVLKTFHMEKKTQWSSRWWPIKKQEKKNKN